MYRQPLENNFANHINKFSSENIYILLGNCERVRAGAKHDGNTEKGNDKSD